MELVKVLKVSEASTIFHVTYFAKPRVLKVFHNNKDPGYAPDGLRDLNRARCEIRAYCRLKRSGLCDSGDVPDFYGYMPAVNPADWTHLDAFKSDVSFPSAVLIEYLPKPMEMNCVTYTEDRMQKAIDIIPRIHEALVEHNDPYPKNIAIVPGNPERVLWIDFDVAIVYSDKSYIGDKEHRWIEYETRLVESYGHALAEDQKEGLPPNTKFY